MIPDLDEWKVFTFRCWKKANNSITVACLICGTLPELVVSGTVECGILFGKFLGELVERRGRGTLEVCE
jgi:hypothetical protein